MHFIDVVRDAYWKKCYDDLEHIISKLEVPYAIIKGIPLSILAFNNVNGRAYSDVDILISRTDLKKVQSVLRDSGYENSKWSRYDKIFALSSSHQDVPFRKMVLKWLRSDVDINFDIFWGEYEGKRIDIEDYRLLFK